MQPRAILGCICWPQPLSSDAGRQVSRRHQRSSESATSACMLCAWTFLECLLSCLKIFVLVVDLDILLKAVFDFSFSGMSACLSTRGRRNGSSATARLASYSGRN
ncbi:hypothetical protein ABBQ38_005404 [Trebouxia sp. C0009 RCD-2024]